MKKCKIVVLENDQQFQGLPLPLQDIYDEHTGDKEVWWWFGEDVRQNTQACLAKFRELAPNCVFITQPSFVGVGNSFDGKLFLFKNLASLGIKIKVNIVYAPDFYWFLIGWLGSKHDKNSRTEALQTLKFCVEYHDIGYSSKPYGNPDSLDIDTLFTALTWDSLMENYFQKGDLVKLKSSGEIVKLTYAYLSDKEERCDFSIDDGIPDEKRRELNMPIKHIRRNKIEKI